jgi:hypothetical protein
MAADFWTEVRVRGLVFQNGVYVWHILRHVFSGSISYIGKTFQKTTLLLVVLQQQRTVRYGSGSGRRRVMTECDEKLAVSQNEASKQAVCG